MSAWTVPKAPRQSTKGLQKINSLEVGEKIFEPAKEEKHKAKNLRGGDHPSLCPEKQPGLESSWTSTWRPPVTARQDFKAQLPFTHHDKTHALKLSKTSRLAISNSISYSQPPTISGFCHYLLSGKSKFRLPCEVFLLGAEDPCT